MTEQINTAHAALQGQGPLEAPGLGTLWLVWSALGLVSIRWPEQGPLEDGPGERAVPRPYAEPLGRYFEGKAVDPALLAVDLRGSAFQRQVWDALRRVPRGRVRSYAGIARDVGSPRAMRAVGAANRENPLPIVVPCHRVVQKGHRLGGYSGGLERKRWLLGLEGVTVEGDDVMPGQLGLL